MQIYEVRISHAARIGMAALRTFLDAMLSEEGAICYANNMRDEIKMLAVYAGVYGKTTSRTLRQIHPEARRMVSHNRRWIYVFHIEGSFVIVDCILPAKMNKSKRFGESLLTKWQNVVNVRWIVYFNNSRQGCKNRHSNLAVRQKILNFAGENQTKDRKLCVRQQ